MHIINSLQPFCHIFICSKVKSCFYEQMRSCIAPFAVIDSTIEFDARWKPPKQLFRVKLRVVGSISSQQIMKQMSFLVTLAVSSTKKKPASPALLQNIMPFVLPLLPTPPLLKSPHRLIRRQKRRNDNVVIQSINSSSIASSIHSI